MAQIVVFVIFGGFGLVLLYVGLTQLVRQRRLLTHAQPVDAVITQSEVFSSTTRDTDGQVGRSNSTTTHRPDVRFRYEVAGQTFESDQMYPNIIVRTYASHDSAAQALAPYPLHGKVRALVDPSLPDKGFLIPEAGSGPVVFIVIGVLLPPIAWFVGALI